MSSKCIFCESTSHWTAIEENGYKGVKCSACDLIYISPRPEFSETVDRYTLDKANTSAESIMHDELSKRLHAKHVLTIIKKFVERGSILEIGAGAGYFLDEAKKKGFDVYGTEINKIQANYINSFLGIICDSTPLSDSSFGGKKFDVIYHCNVLSHFYDPITEYRRIREKLKDDGILVFETGNIGDVKNKYYKFFRKFDYPDHLFFYGEKSLSHLVKLTKFKIIKIYHYSILPQLTVEKIVQKLRGARKYPVASLKLGDKFITNGSFGNGRVCGLKELLKKARVHFLYLLTYKFGHILSRNGQPQTFIVVARRADDKGLEVAN